MFKLVRLNIERVVTTEHARDILLSQGYKLVEEKEQQDSTGDKSLKDLTVDQLKMLAEEKGLEVPSKIKKDDLIEMLKEVE